MSLDAFDQGFQYFPSSGTAIFRKREYCREGGRDRVSRRVPHRLVIEHMHRGPVRVCGAHHGSLEAEVQYGRLIGTAKATNMCSNNSRGDLLAAGHCYCNAVEDEGATGI